MAIGRKEAKIPAVLAPRPERPNNLTPRLTAQESQRCSPCRPPRCDERPAMSNERLCGVQTALWVW